MPRVRRSHHVLRIEHLLSELRDRDGTVLLASTSSQRRETSHKEVQTRERDYNVILISDRYKVICQRISYPC